MKTIESSQTPLAQLSFSPQRATASNARKRDSLPLSEVVPFYFAISSPLLGVLVGLVGAWFVTWITT